MANSNAEATVQAANSEPEERKILYWVDPMHPAYKSDKPGKAPDCGMDLVPVYEGGDIAEQTAPAGSVKIDPAKQQLIGVALGEVSDEPLVRTIRAVGKVTFDETKVAHIHTKFEGWIERVFVGFTGDLVRKGQPLLSIYSPELVSSQQELFIAKRAKDYLGNNRDQEISSNALSLYNSARERLRLWDIPDAEIQRIEERGTPIKALTLYSPLNGFVTTRNAFEQQKVTPDTDLYTIADLTTVWVMADVYEYEIPQIQLGQPATVTLSYFPGKKFRGKVAYINPQLDPTTRTLKVRVEVPNPNFELKPDMFANVDIQIDYGKRISVPSEAVLDSGSEQIVFVAHEGGYFEPRKVELGGKVDNRFIVLSGLQRGEKIVTSGNFLIDSESRLKSATGAMGHAGHGGGLEDSTQTSGQQDHSQHQQPKTGDHSEHSPKVKDHSQYQQPKTDDHSGHRPKAEDHGNHQPPKAEDHSGHQPQAEDHSGHQPAQHDHSGHATGGKRP
ncbi:MAG: efflux RND transporter periplasmic adaptor subunit [Terriglobales bacterium]